MLRHENTLADELSYPAARRTALHRNHVAILRETKLDPVGFGHPFHDAHVSALVSAARGVDVDTAAVHRSNVEFRRELRERYGAQDAERLLADTNRFLQAHPKLRAVVTMPGFATSAMGKQAMEAIVEHVGTRKHLR